MVKQQIFPPPLLLLLLDLGSGTTDEEKSGFEVNIPDPQHYI